MPNGIEPNISLQAQGAGQQPAPLAGVSNALGVEQGLLGVQSSQIALAQQQQQFQANQKFGQIMATSSDPESAVKQMQSDPLGAYMMDALGKYTGAMNQYRSYLGQVQTQNASGFTSVLKGLLEGIDDPTQIVPQTQANLKLLPPDIRQGVEPAVNAVLNAATDNLPAGPAGVQILKNRIAGIMVGSGAATPEMTRATTGSLAPQVTHAVGPQGQQENVQVGGGLAGETTPQALGQTGEPGSAAPLTAGPTLFQAQRLPEVAQYRSTLDSIVNQAGQQLKTMDQIKTAMQSAETGGGAAVRAQLGSLLQAIPGMPQAFVDQVANGSLPSTQEIEKQVGMLTAGQMANQLPPEFARGHEMFQQFMASNPGLTSDPRLFDKIFNFYTNLYSQAHDEQTTMDQYASGTGQFKGQGPGDLTQWQRVWQDQAQKKGYIKPGEFTEAGVIGKPPAANIPTGAPAYLKAHPETRAQFDAKYGQGASAGILGQ